MISDSVYFVDICYCTIISLIIMILMKNLSLQMMTQMSDRNIIELFE